MRKIAANYLFPITSPPIKQGYVVLNDQGLVCEIGQLHAESAQTEYYEGILCPGFVNAHTHTELSHLAGQFCSGTGQSDFIRQINSLRSNISQEQSLKAISEAFEQMYLQGISAIGDICNGSESFAVKQQTPIASRSFIEVYGQRMEEASTIMEKATQLLAQAHSTGLDAGISPHALYSMSPELLRQACTAAQVSGFLSIHNQESWEEETLFASGAGPMADSFIARQFPLPQRSSAPSLLNLLPHLSPDTSTLLVHNTFTTEFAYDALIQATFNAGLVLCPNSNLFINKALPPIPMFQRKGARIAIGTDSLASNHQLSIIEELKTIHRFFPQIDLAQMLGWATLNGAKALGMEKRFGSLEPGKRPGLLLISNIHWSSMNLTPHSRVTRLSA